jgi:hypothetical protein
MKQLCDDLSQLAIQVRQLGYSLGGGVGERGNAWISVNACSPRLSRLRPEWPALNPSRAFGYPNLLA